MNAWKLTRIEKREKPRTDWPERWRAAGEKCDFQGASRSEMIALKNSPIWHWLGQGIGGFDDATGEDTPPFAINSGLGWIGCNFEDKARIQTMNENKTKLILKIATQLSDEQCAAILERIESNPTLLANKLIACANEWEESKHPRAEDGKFAPGGSGRAEMTKSQVSKWDRIGKTNPNPNRSEKLKTIKREIDRLRDKVEIYEESFPHDKHLEKVKSDLVAKQREYSEAIREWKHEERKKVEKDAESTISKRVMKRKAKEYSDIEDEIDYMEEKYADRNPNSPTQDEVVFPKTKAGEKARQKYEELKKRREELDAEIDWDKVEEDE